MGADPVNLVDPDGGSAIDMMGRLFAPQSAPIPLKPASWGTSSSSNTASSSSGSSGGALNSLGNAAAGALGQYIANKLFPLPQGPDAGNLQQAPTNTSTSAGGIDEKSGNYWIKYNGKKVNIYQGDFGDENNSVLIESFAGTSGGAEYQNSKNQDIPRKGPVPEGNYSVDLSISPRNRKVSYAPTGETNQDVGIQQMVDRSGNGFNAEWGRWRARLQKTSNNTSRDAFYLHDSYKGYSHGCIETETSLFYFLLSLHDAGVLNIKVQVQYPNGNSPTNGGTKGLPLNIPDNVKPYYKQYGYPPGSMGNKRYGKIPVPPRNYEYIPEYKFVPNK